MFPEIRFQRIHRKDPEYLDAASALVDSVTEAQSADVDTVSGATLSSNGILEAVRDCLTQAGKEA